VRSFLFVGTHPTKPYTAVSSGPVCGEVASSFVVPGGVGLSGRTEMTYDGRLPASPLFPHLSPLRRDADAHATEAYLPCLYPANEGPPKDELSLFYWMERRSRVHFLCKHRGFDILDGSPGSVRPENKNMFGASAVTFSTTFAEQGSDEFSPSPDVLEYSNIDPLLRDNLVRSRKLCPLGSFEAASPKEVLSGKRQTVTSLESDVKTQVRETSLVSPGVQNAVPGYRSLGVTRLIRARDRFSCPFPGCRKYFRTALRITLSSASLQTPPFPNV
jgi:hypothetical protein